MSSTGSVGGPPREPQPGECCGSGCARCVWDVYFDALADYEAKRGAGATETGPTSTDPSHYVAEPQPGAYDNAVVVKFISEWELQASRDSGEPLEDELGNPIRPWEAMWHAKGSEWTAVKSPALKWSSGAAESAPLFAASIPLPTAKLEHTEPGDAVELMAPNASRDVETVAAALGLDPSRPLVLKKSPFVGDDVFPPWLPAGVSLTVGELLTHCVDLNSRAAIHVGFMAMLGRHAKDAEEKAELERLSAAARMGRRGPWHAAAVEPHPTVGELMKAFPSTRPPLARFLEASLPLRPRKFSVAGLEPGESTEESSAVEVLLRSPWVGIDDRTKVHDGSSEKLLAAVRAAGCPFRGHCSARLFDAGTDPSNANVLPLFARTAKGTVGLSVPHTTPLLLVGAGAGIAPIRYLLQRRLAASAAGPVAASRLYFGCRTESELQHIFPDLEAFRKAGLLESGNAGLVTAVSRSASSAFAAVPRTRITDVLRNQAASIASFFTDETSQSAGPAPKPILVACGPTGMLEELTAAMKDAVVPTVPGEVDESMQDVWWSRAVDGGRVLFDTWSNAQSQPK